MSSKETKPSFCYILGLQNNKYYVGSAFTPKNRYREHWNGKGSSWTRNNPPITVLKEIKCSSLGESLVTEDALTLWMMVKYGKDNVRGGRWLKENCNYIPELKVAGDIVARGDFTKQQIKESLEFLVFKSGVTSSWYWHDFLEKYPSIKQGVYFKGMLKRLSMEVG
jgi:predicted GIY-YIG superfamily endonuclease